MPDWFYRTVSRPLLFSLPAPRARDFALGFMGGLARLPLGETVIDFLGHMRADPRLRRSLLGIDFPSVVGLGPGLDSRAVALPALARFGFGFLEVGPVTVRGAAADRAVERLADQEAIWFSNPPGSLSLAELAPRLARASRFGIPLMVRLGYRAESTPSTPEQVTEDCQRLVREIGPFANLFVLSEADGWPVEKWAAHVRAVVEAASRPVLLVLTADQELGVATPFLEAGLAAGAGGLLVDGSVAAEKGGRLIGSPARGPALEQVRGLRLRFGRNLPIVAAGGVHEPAHALELRAAGADLVQIDSGLVYTGPGLAKRVNEALLYEATHDAPPPPPERAPEMTWFWMTLMGAGMLFGSLLALVIAATRVVLPYDEAFANMSREELLAVNPRLLAFMAHDRVSLAGTMVAIGIMYIGLSAVGIRRGLHWAQQTVFISAATGFASFFLFLGFGYLDPFHAFVTAALLQLLLLGVHCRLGTYTPAVRPDLHTDRAWRLAQWGQFLLVLHGFALLGAGMAISLIGVTEVFVPEDLAFMQTTADALRSANPRLVPLVAHDRATFGGMLLASGWAFLLPALWGFRTGSAWLWWTLLAAGLSAYAAAIGVHYAVGYTDPMHLLPAFSGLGLFLLGLALARPYLCQRNDSAQPSA